MLDDPVIVEHLTPEEHLEKADKALAHATKLRDELEKIPDRDLLTHPKTHAFLTALQIINTHSNMATAKTLVLIKNLSAPIEFHTPLPWPDVMERERSRTDLSGSSDIDAINAGFCPLHRTPLNNGRCGIDGGAAHPSRRGSHGS